MHDPGKRLEGLIHPRVNPWCSVFDRIKKVIQVKTLMFRQIILLFSTAFIIFTAITAIAQIRQGPLIMENSSSVSGRILIDCKEPMSGGIAAFFNAALDYPPKFGSLRRVPDRVAPVGPDGEFKVALPAGRYYLGVINRNDPGETGPPGLEEKGFSAVDEAGDRKIFELAGSGAAKDLGTVSVSTMERTWESADLFTIRGKVINKEGQPFENAWILIKRNPDAKRPDFISQKVGTTGRFELQLPAGRPYFLLAKDVSGAGRPQSGGHVGAYTGADPVFNQYMPEPKPAPLSAEAGQVISDIVILMIEVPDNETREEYLQGRMIKKP
jgi:hypothetical protein